MTAEQRVAEEFYRLIKAQVKRIMELEEENERLRQVILMERKKISANTTCF